MSETRNDRATTLVIPILPLFIGPSSFFFSYLLGKQRLQSLHRLSYLVEQPLRSRLVPLLDSDLEIREEKLKAVQLRLHLVTDVEYPLFLPLCSLQALYLCPERLQQAHPVLLGLQEAQFREVGPWFGLCQFRLCRIALLLE